MPLPGIALRILKRTPVRARPKTAAIGPLLANPPIAKIIKATGFSPRYASLVRKGEYMPHPVHYSTFARLAGSREEEEAPIL
jgi:hypothetical protein